MLANPEELYLQAQVSQSICLQGGPRSTSFEVVYTVTKNRLWHAFYQAHSSHGRKARSRRQKLLVCQKLRIARLVTSASVIVNAMPALLFLDMLQSK